MPPKLKSSQWSDFSDRVVSVCQLPKGTELRLYRKSDSRKVRSDFTIKRKLITSENIKSIRSGDTVSDFLSKIRMLLSTDIETRGFEIRLYAPDGSKIWGNTLIQNVKKMEPVVTSDDSDIFEVFLGLVEKSGLDELSLKQVKALYDQLRLILGDDLDRKLIRNKQILVQ